MNLFFNTISTVAILISLISCNKNLTKQQAFESFVKDELSRNGKDLKVQKFILTHYNFINSEELYYGETFDTNHVSLFVKNKEDEIAYSFRVVGKANDDGVDNYDDGIVIYNTKGNVNQDDFRKLAYFLYAKNKELNELSLDDLNEFKISLLNRLKIANLNLMQRGFTKLNIEEFLHRINLSEDKRTFDVLLKNKKVGQIYHANQFAKTDKMKLIWDEISNIDFDLSKNKIIRTNFLEKCETVKSNNCNSVHITNIFIKYNGVYYGIDKWKEIL
jgi:hypothetical protein